MAIKVNGTTVIDDSRALNNIASVDATTVAALGAAGVGGGAVELITGKTSFSGVTSVTLSLNSAYDIHVVQFFSVTHNDGGAEDFQLRLGNSSGSIITSATYEYQKGLNTALSVSRSWIEIADNVDQSGSGSMPACEVVFYSAADSSTRTTTTSWASHTGPNAKIAVGIGGRPGTTEVNANAYFFFDASPSFSGSYKVWGYKL